MIQSGTKLKVADNTGALVANCIHVYKDSVGKAGSLIKVSIRKVEPNSKIKKGSMHRAVIIRTKAKQKRPDGTFICCNENACVIVDDKGEPKGTSVFGSAMKEVRQSGCIKVSQQADEVI